MWTKSTGITMWIIIYVDYKSTGITMWIIIYVD